MSSQSSLFKIPFILISSLCVHISFTSPNPPPKPHEMLQYEKKDSADVVPIMKINGPQIKRVFVHIINALEIITILASESYLHIPKPLSSLSSSTPYITPMFLFGTAMMCVSAVMRLACYHNLGRLFTFELSLRDNHKLVTNGPYAWVRHPSYTACMFYIAGELFTHYTPGSWWYEAGMWGSPVAMLVWLVWMGFLGATIAFYFSRADLEDGILRGEFKDDWVAWSRRTPYKFVPYVF